MSDATFRTIFGIAVYVTMMAVAITAIAGGLR